MGNTADQERTDRIFTHIRTLDDLLDDYPYESLKQHGLIPQNVDAVISSTGPCGFLMEVLSAEARRELESLAGDTAQDRENMWKLFNGAVFHLAQMAEVGARINPPYNAPDNIDNIELLAARNMQWSHLATHICAHREYGIAISEVVEQLPTLLGDDLLPNAFNRTAKLKDKYRVSDIDSLIKEKSYKAQIANDRSDMFSDIDKEMGEGKITPNVVLAWARAMTYSQFADIWDAHAEEYRDDFRRAVANFPPGISEDTRTSPGSWTINEARAYYQGRESFITSITLPRSDAYIDMHAIYNDIVRQYPDIGKVSAEQIKEASPLAFALLYDLHRDRGLGKAAYFYLTDEAKRQGRLAKHAAEAVIQGGHDVSEEHIPHHGLSGAFHNGMQRIHNVADDVVNSAKNIVRKMQNRLPGHH